MENRDALLELVRGVLGEERVISLCELFNDSMGQVINLRYEAFDSLPTGQALGEIGKLYKLFQEHFVGYKLRLYVSSYQHINLASMETVISSERLIAISGTRGNSMKLRLAPIFANASESPEWQEGFIVIDETVEMTENMWERLKEIRAKYQ